MTYNWSPASPAETGFAPDLEARLDKAIADQRIWNLHGLVVLRNDRLVLERYFEGNDHVRGIGPVGHVTFKQDTLHDLRSCSKSIVGLLYGIALQQGLVPPPEASLFSAFPEHADLAQKDGRDRLTIHHVLTMTMGTDWDESSLVYSDPRNSETAMDNAPDRYRYILERKVVGTPGRVLDLQRRRDRVACAHHREGRRKTLHQFARENLFDPLGMGPTEWATSPDGEPFAASGARMSVRDLARLGQMMLHGGKIGGQGCRAGRLAAALHHADCELRRSPSLWLSMVHARHRFRQAQGLGGRPAGADVDGAGRRRPAPVHHPRAATRHRHDRRKLRQAGPGDSPDACPARSGAGERRVRRGHANLSRRMFLKDVIGNW